MRKTLQLIAICAFGVMLASPALARASSLTSGLAEQDQCTPENKTAWYTDFTANLKTNQAKAYEDAKKYLACPADKDDDPKITEYVKSFAAKYEKAARKDQLHDLIYNKKDFPKAFELGKQITTDEPENLRVLIDLAYGGSLAAADKNESFNTDAVAYAKKAIQLIESGKALESWVPFKGKDDTLASLYYTIGTLTIKSNPAEAVSPLIKSAQSQTELKKYPYTYYFIALAYDAGSYAKLTADYLTKYQGKDETPESKLALANINQIADRIIDAYARAVALAGNDAKFQQAKTEWLDRLTELYKFRHGKSDAGLNEMIAGILAKPLPPEPTPLTELPATPTATPTSGTAATAAPAAKTGVATTTAAPTAKTEVSKTSTGAPSTGTGKPGNKTKPKTRSNHRRPSRG